MADVQLTHKVFTELQAKEFLSVNQNTGITYDLRAGKPVDVYGGFGLHSTDTPTTLDDWSLNNHAIDKLASEKELISAVSASNGKDNDASDISILGNDKVTFAGINDQTHKAAATSQFMSNYNDNQLYGVSPGNNIKVVDLNQNLNDEILNTSHADLEKASGVAFENAKKEGAKNAAKLVAEMKADNLAEQKAIEKEIAVFEDELEQQLVNDRNLEFQQTLATSQAVDDMIVEAEKAAKAKQKELDDAAEPTFHFKDLNKDGKVSTAEDERWILDHGGYTINGQFVKADGRTYAQVLAEMANDEQQNISGSFIESDESTIVPIDDDSKAELQALENAKWQLSDGSVVPANGHDALWHENLLEAKKEAEKNAAEIMKEIKAEDFAKKKEVWDRKEKQAGEPELWRDRIGRDYLESERQKEISEVQEKWTDNNQYVERHGAEIHQEIAEFEKDDTLVDRHPVFDKTKKELADLEAKATDDLSDFEAKIRAGLKKEQERLSGSQDSPGGDDHFGGADVGLAAESNRNQLQKVLDQNNQNKIIEKNDMAFKPSGKGTHRSAGKDRFGFRKNKLYSTDPYAFSTLSYPKDVVEDFTNGHYMLFYVNAQNYTKYTYDGYDDTGKVVTVGDMVESHRENVWTGDTPFDSKLWKDKWEMNNGANAGEIAHQKRMIQKGRVGNILKHNQTTLMKGRKAQTGLASYYPTTTRITDSVAIYLPPNVSDNTSASYNDFQTGMAGYLAMGGVDILQQLRDHDFQGAASILMEKGGMIATEALKKFAVAGIEGLTGSEGVEQTFNKAFGQSLNPYMEVAFDNMGLRSFTYTFHFAPKSPEESLEVKDIIQLFRFHMAPELKDTNHRYLTLPSTFDIHYMFQSGMGDKDLAKENTFYNKIATCVLKGCDVNYTPGGVRSFDSGAPTQIDMTLSFTETEMLTKQKINDGY